MNFTKSINFVIFYNGDSMIQIFTTPSCSSCRKAKKWLEEHNISYVEKNLFQVKITDNDIKDMLKNTLNGFDDIISQRAKIIKENNIDINKMKYSELVEFIKENPSILKRPIIIDDNKLQVGYNDEEIRVFIPKELRKHIMCTNCKGNNDCEYQMLLKEQLGSIEINKTE